MGVIFYLSSMSGDLLPNDLPDNSDKLVHAVLYGVLAASALRAFCRLLPGKPLLLAVVALLFCLIYGISDEWHQSFVPGRTASIWDIAADATGALVVVLGYSWMRRSQCASQSNLHNKED